MKPLCLLIELSQLVSYNKIAMNIPNHNWCNIEDPPAAPSGVMTTYDQFTQTGAFIDVTWSTSSGADNYTIKVTPPVMPEQSDFTTTATSLKLILVYNVNYSINITAHNCAGSNSSLVAGKNIDLIHA